MYGIFAYIWLIFMVNVGKYTIHGSYGVWLSDLQLVDKKVTAKKHLANILLMKILPLKTKKYHPYYW